jgi:molybdate transport system substrate-binding protein
VNLYGQRVRVAAAANLRYVLDDLRTFYAARKPGVAIEVTLGASGALVTQILNGAPYDFFMAADRSFPEKLKAAGAAAGEVKTYAVGRLVLWSDVIDVRKGIDVVADSSVVHIAVANPDIAPYGERAIQALRHAGLLDRVKSKLVFADNISQAAQFASSGNAEAGFLALGIVLAPEMKGKGTYALIDPESYSPVEQACVLVKSAVENPEAAAFMSFVLSDSCRPVFEKYGYAQAMKPEK